MTYHFIGIGGIGMSALAKLLLEKGEKVQGTDVTPSSITKELAMRGAKIFSTHEESNIQEGMTIVYSSAIGEDNPERVKAKNLQLTFLHRSELLEKLAREKNCLMVTGSHGKTTTTSLLAHVFQKRDPSFALGGLFEGTNAKSGKGAEFILEGDESDGSFLKALPFAAICTSFDPDHMEFWKTEECLEEAFQTFFKNTKHLFWCDEDGLKKLDPPGKSYGFSDSCDVFAKNIRFERFCSIFDVHHEMGIERGVILPLTGRHQVLNALGVISLALFMKIPFAEIRESLATFRGVQRRMEHKGKVFGIDFFDDYAHHPSEIRATLQAFQKAASPRRVVCVFEPHRFARFSRFYEDFLTSFSAADLLIVTDIYGAFAGEEDVSAEKFAKTLNAPYLPKDQLFQKLSEHLMPFDAVIFMGAGDLSHLIPKFLEASYRKLKVALLYGGATPEHEVSVISSRYAQKGLSREEISLKEIFISKEGKWSEEPLSALKEIDLVIPILHGPSVEDGVLQGFLETLHIPFAGSSAKSSAFAMNKAHTKAFLEKEGILTAPFITALKIDDVEEICKKAQQLHFPVWVKACGLGSSIGVFRVERPEYLKSAVEKVFTFDDELIIEEEVLDRQIEVAVFGHGDEVEVLPPCELLSKGAFCDYEGKYGKNAFPYDAPARLPADWTKKVQALAKRIFQLSKLSVYARIDFFLNDYGEFYFNEINPLPGLTPTSAYPIMCRNAGFCEKDVMDKIIAYALYAERTKA